MKALRSFATSGFEGVCLGVRILLGSLVGWLLWDWFLVPLGLPQITYWHAFGLYVILSFLTLKLPKGEEIIEDIVQYLLLLFLGWLASGMMT